MAKNYEFPSTSFSNRDSSNPIDNEIEEGMSRQDHEKDSEYFRIRKDYRAIRNNCSEIGIKFTDYDFPADMSSLLTNKLDRKKNGKNGNDFDSEKFLKSIQYIEGWHRPEDISLTERKDDRKGDDWVLIKDAYPSDIRQGQLGNCWFMAALALIAERRELLSKIFITKKYNSVGVYALRLFKDGQWKGVIIDDLFPCDSYNRLIYSRCSKKQLWVPLVEKAMSKLHGSYESLQSGTVSDGLNYLTGFVCERINFESEKDHEFLWARLLSFHEADFLMEAHITSTDELQTKYFKDEMGLITNHEYSVLRVVCMENNRLIQLRNPWGRFSWKGDWSDGSKLWNEILSDHLSPHRSEEGIFWMSFQDFVNIYSGLEVCKIRHGWSIYSVEGILPPYADPDCQPCFKLVCEESCEVDISLYQSSKRNARETVEQTDIGFMVLETNGFDPSSKKFKLVKPLELTLSARQRVISCNLMLKPGVYFLVPFSFSHWTTRENEETFYPFALTIHSSRDLLRFEPILQQSNILADSLICCSKYFGDRRNFSLGKYSDKISIISMNLGYGHCTVLENYCEDVWVELEMDCKVTKGEYISTRQALSTQDKLGPQKCQVIQVFTPRDIESGGTSCSYSYKVQITDGFRQLRLDNNLAHVPRLCERTEGLHRPRPA